MPTRTNDSRKSAPRQRAAAGSRGLAFTPNRTGLPDELKSGIENLSGLSLDDVLVHYNSPKPAGLQALAYTQGADIHVGPGQERHLPQSRRPPVGEAWHVIQQKQGRVKATGQLNNAQINEDAGLEKEASRMGDFAAVAGAHTPMSLPTMKTNKAGPVQRFKRGGDFIERKHDPLDLSAPQTPDEARFGKSLIKLGEKDLKRTLISDDYQAIRDQENGLLLTDQVEKANHGLKKVRKDIVIDTPRKEKETFSQYVMDGKFTTH